MFIVFILLSIVFFGTAKLDIEYEPGKTNQYETGIMDSETEIGGANPNPQMR